jgi:HEAT repeat protein
MIRGVIHGKEARGRAKALSLAKLLLALATLIPAGGCGEKKPPSSEEAAASSRSDAAAAISAYLKAIGASAQARLDEARDMSPFDEDVKEKEARVKELAKDPSVRAECAARLKEAYWVPATAGYRGIEDTAFKLQAVEAIDAILGPEAEPLLEEILFDPKIHFLVRSRVAGRLADLNPGKAAELFKKLLAAGGGKEEKLAQILGIFGARKLPGARELLLETLLQSEDQDLRNRAAIDLKFFPDPEVEAALFTRLSEDPSMFVRANCLHGLLTIAPERMKPRLEEILERERSAKRQGHDKLAAEVERQIRLRDQK